MADVTPPLDCARGVPCDRDRGDPEPAEGPPRLKRPVSDDDWSRGPAGAVSLVEYLDYQCPACQAAHPVVERVLASLPDRVRFVVRHFPIASAHPQAQRAALAAEAAGRQGKFWEMHQRLFAPRGALQEDQLLSYAGELGLDLARFGADMADEGLAAKIRREKVLGVRSGVNGTPTFYIAEARYEGETGPLREEELKAAILAELDRNQRH